MKYGIEFPTIEESQVRLSPGQRGERTPMVVPFTHIDRIEPRGAGEGVFVLVTNAGRSALVDLSGTPALRVVATE